MVRGLTKDAMWQGSFPHLYALCRKQSSYTIPNRERLTRSLQSGLMLVGERSNAVLRLDMAIACLWPQISYLFVSDTFPHRLAAATDILRAVSFGEGQAEQVRELANELVAALDALERLLAAQHAELLRKQQEQERERERKQQDPAAERQGEEEK